MKERSTSHVYAKVTFPDQDGKKLTGKQLFNVLDFVCKNDATVLTDDYNGYRFMDSENKDRNPNNYIRVVVNHSAG